jgi:hypothetical protein
MPIPVSCHICGARLSVPEGVAGKQVKCPKCDTAVPVPAADPGFEVVDETPAARPAVARPAVAAPARPRPADDVDDRPRRRARDEEGDDDDEDRPRSRRRVTDEDDEDDRPARRKPKGKKKRSNLPLLLVGGAVGLFLLVGGAIVAILTFLIPKDDKPRFPNQQPVAVAGPGRSLGGSSKPVPPASVPADWKTFSTPGSGLTVSVPVALQTFNVPGRMRKPGVSIAMWQALHNNSKVYQVMVITVTKGRAPTGPTSDRDLEVLCDGLGSSNDFGRERSCTHVNVGGHNGRQVVFDSAVIRVTAVGRKAYFLTVATKGGAVNASDPDVTAFLESAKISG